LANGPAKGYGQGLRQLSHAEHAVPDRSTLDYNRFLCEIDPLGSDSSVERTHFCLPVAVHQGLPGDSAGQAEDRLELNFLAHFLLYSQLLLERGFEEVTGELPEHRLELERGQINQTAGNPQGPLQPTPPILPLDRLIQALVLLLPCGGGIREAGLRQK